MTKKLLLLTSVIAVFSISDTSLASDTHNDPHNAEQAIKHYEGADISNTNDALKILRGETKNISTILLHESLTPSQIEDIHQISYRLEDAIDVLITKKAFDAKTLKSADAEIQAIHHASEDREEAVIRKSFDQLSPIVDAIDLQ